MDADTGYTKPQAGRARGIGGSCLEVGEGLTDGQVPVMGILSVYF